MFPRWHNCVKHNICVLFISLCFMRTTFFLPTLLLFFFYNLRCLCWMWCSRCFLKWHISLILLPWQTEPFNTFVANSFLTLKVVFSSWSDVVFAHFRSVFCSSFFLSFFFLNIFIQSHLKPMNWKGIPPRHYMPFCDCITDFVSKTPKHFTCVCFKQLRHCLPCPPTLPWSCDTLKERKELAE